MEWVMNFSKYSYLNFLLDELRKTTKYAKQMNTSPVEELQMRSRSSGFRKFLALDVCSSLICVLGS